MPRPFDKLFINAGLSLQASKNITLVLDFKEFRRIRGVDADPASYLQIRFWVNTAITIDLRDPKDKTPYWLISTNRASELAKLLNVADH